MRFAVLYLSERLLVLLSAMWIVRLIMCQLVSPLVLKGNTADSIKFPRLRPPKLYATRLQAIEPRTICHLKKSGRC